MDASAVLYLPKGFADPSFTIKVTNTQIMRAYDLRSIHEEADQRIVHHVLHVQGK